jgi:hypothetical protein
MGFLVWLEESGLGIFIRESLWGYPIVLSSHSVGMATVMGVVVALNFRVLGFANGISILAFDKLFFVGWFGFLINLVSGLILFCNTPTTYFFQGAFQIKIAFIVAGGVLMKVVMNSVRGDASEGMTKVASAACIACWFGGVITGRLMAYM